jgi:hypothetical protein
MENQIINMATAIEKSFDKIRVSFKKMAEKKQKYCIHNGRMAHKIPITKIDHIYVDVYLYCEIFEKADDTGYVERCHINITINQLFDERQDCEYVLLQIGPSSYNFETDKPVSLFDQLLIVLSNLFSNIDKYKLSNNGRLINIDDEEFMFESINLQIIEALKDSKNIEMEIPKECSICYNNTNTKTPCNHQLCMRCWSAVMHEHVHPDDDTDESEAPCPICRKDIRCT